VKISKGMGHAWATVSVGVIVKEREGLGRGEGQSGGKKEGVSQCRISSCEKTLS